MKLAYICTNYNNSHYTVAAIESLAANSGHELLAIVVDNASSEAERAVLHPLSTRWPWILLIESPINTGYFGGLNLGLRELATRRPDIEWVVAGNNDLEFPADFCNALQGLVPALNRHAVVSPDVVTLDGEHQNPHVISHISAFRELMYDLYFANYHLGRVIKRIARKLPALSERDDEQHWRIGRYIYQGHGSCYVLGPRFLREFGELWAPTLLMSEEFFLSKQLQDAGQQVWYEPGLRVTHRWHGSLDQLPVRQRWEIARTAHHEYRKYVKPLPWH
ncbi:MAG: glycosyltransferase family 2 protein [Aquincola sp.]|nr:glycosyltransferase family 2 protein [Aquincola sp.]NJN00307.1 glycosyltransferase family 2 protein [Aquincola sp.]